MSFTRVAGFLPSQNGFHFANNYPSGTAMYPAVSLPLIGTVIAGDAGNGLCGGFVMAALDLFRHNPRLFPPLDVDRPPSGSPMFNYLCDRLLDSFGETAQGFYGNAMRVIEWIRTPQTDGILGPGLGWRMANNEWPKIKADIDAGRPSPLSLVAGPERGLPDITGTIDTLHHCHQVLAYAYELDTAQNLTLLVYDCNDPMNDNSKISLNLAGPSPAQIVSAPAISAALGGTPTIRAFFRPDYVLHDPTVVADHPLTVGHANNVVAMAAANGKLFCATSDNKLWARDPVLSDVVWQEIGHANFLVAMTAIGGRLYCATTDGQLWSRDAVLSDIVWQPSGQAANVVGLAAIDGQLVCATGDDKLWARDGGTQNLPWQPLGHANQVVSMTATQQKLICATRDSQLWMRDPGGGNLSWQAIGHVAGAVGMAALDGKLFYATNDNRLLARPAP
jgi:hypothetical protein